MLLGNNNILSNGSAYNVSVQNVRVRDGKNDIIYRVRKCKNVRLLYQIEFIKNNDKVVVEFGSDVIIAGSEEDISAQALHRRKSEFITESGHKFRKSEHIAGYATKLYFNDDITILVNNIPIRAYKQNRILKCF